MKTDGGLLIPPDLFAQTDFRLFSTIRFRRLPRYSCAARNPRNSLNLAMYKFSAARFIDRVLIFFGGFSPVARISRSGANLAKKIQPANHL